MFGAFTEKFQKFFSSLAGQKTLSEEAIADAVKEVRLALLEADVNYSIVSDFIKRVKEKSLGAVAVKKVLPGQQFIAQVHEELVSLMGGEEAPLRIEGSLAVVLLAGLQGSGKTTTCVKLAHFIQKHHKKKVLMAACDLQRPAAVEQLKKLGAEAGVDVYTLPGTPDPLKVATAAKQEAIVGKYQVLLVDTAGRLHVDEELMAQLEQLKACLEPKEILFVANGTSGQDAVKTAAAFNQRIEITGTILTMLDSNARGGAAISIREVTGKPLKFEGIGEKIADFQVFHPRSMADRILGMGDVINLVKRAQENFDEEQEKELEKKFKQASFTYEDYLKQMGRVRKMGSLKSLLKMMPGFGSMGDFEMSDQEFRKMESVIFSMTPEERQEKVELEHLRRKRLSKGSGVPLDDVNRLVKGFKKVKQLFKNMPDMKSSGKKLGLSDLNELKKQFEGKTWR
jgi:signal recognition particle subunit SRP54